MPEHFPEGRATKFNLSCEANSLRNGRAEKGTFQRRFLWIRGNDVGGTTDLPTIWA